MSILAHIGYVGSSFIAWFSFVPVIFKFKLYSWLPGILFGFSGDILNTALSHSNEMKPEVQKVLIHSYHITRMLFALSIIPGLLRYRCRILAALQVISFSGTALRVIGKNFTDSESVAKLGLTLIMVVFAF